MRTLFKRSVAAAALTLALTNTPQAGGIPVIDVAGIAQLMAQLRQMGETYQKEIEQLQTLQDQYATLTSQLEAITGAKDLGGILGKLGNAEDLLPDDALGDIAEQVIAGHGAGALGSEIDAIIALYGLEGLDDVITSEVARDRSAAQSAGVSASAIALGEAGAGRAGDMIERAGELREEVGTQDDLKAAIDYNTLVLTEIAQNQAAIARLLGAQLMHDGTSGLAQSRGAVERLLLRVEKVPETATE